MYQNPIGVDWNYAAAAVGVVERYFFLPYGKCYLLKGDWK